MTAMKPLSTMLSLCAVLIASGCAMVPKPAAEAPAAANYSWVSFDAQRLRSRTASGIADRRTQRPLEAADQVRIASVSKLVVAIGVMRLVEAGTLDLDRDVSHWLGWTLRNPAFPAEPISLRMLLSHTSGLRDDVDYAVPLGTEIRTVLAAPAAFNGEHRPGSYFRYSNLNFPVIASVMEAATGERFDRLMKRIVLSHLNLDACFNWATCGEAIERAVVLYDGEGKVLRDDLRGQAPSCPVLAPAGAACDLSSYRPGTNGALFSPQGGLRISADGLATVGALLLNKGRHNGRRFLAKASVETMLAPQWRFNGTNGDTEEGFYCGYGLGVQIIPNGGCRDDLLGNGTMLLGHAGEAYGVRSGLWIDPKRRRGIAYYATGVPENAPKGGSAFVPIEEWLARTAMREGR
jgi:CubicO group peptidase (beta-lactamase class C family)